MFYVDPRDKSKRLPRCKTCVGAYQANWYRTNPVARLLHGAKMRAREKGWKFDLEPEDISPLPAVCPVLGIKLRAAGKPRDYSAYSLDRIDNAKGYVRGNVAVMSYLANRLKNDGTAEQHEKIAAWLRSKGMP